MWEAQIYSLFTQKHRQQLALVIGIGSEGSLVELSPCLVGSDAQKHQNSVKFVGHLASVHEALEKCLAVLGGKLHQSFTDEAAFQELVLKRAEVCYGKCRNVLEPDSVPTL